MLVASLVDHGDQAIGIVVGTIPWYLFMRLLRRTREAHEVTKGLVRELEASRSAEAEAAAEAERSRLAREMHDVLAHSLSALALQLESTRLLAADRGTDPEVSRAIERAHGLARVRPGGGAARDRRAARRGAARAAAAARPGRGQRAADPLRRLRRAARARARRPARAVPDGPGGADQRAPPRGPGRRRAAPGLPRRRHGARRRRPRPRGRPAAAAVNGDGGGYGLAGMRERAELLGGHLSARPTPDGFRVELWLPA